MTEPTEAVVVAFSVPAENYAVLRQIAQAKGLEVAQLCREMAQERVEGFRWLEEEADGWGMDVEG